jgi:hypothetical protein
MKYPSSRITHETVLHSFDTLPDARWWESLESNFYRRPEGFQLSLADRLKVGPAAAFDRVVRTIGSTGLALTIFPFGYHSREFERSLEDRAFYQPMADSGDARWFFRDPPAIVPIEHGQPRGLAYRPPNGTCELVSFESPFETANPRLRSRYAKLRRNRTAYARYWRHHHGPRPTIVIVHGFTADPFWLNELFFDVRWFYEIGCDVLLFTMPFHGRRQPRVSFFSGHRFFGGGISHINEAFAQTIYDARVLIRYLTDRVGVPQIGVTGISLGGMTAAMLASVESRLAFSIPNVPVVTLGDLVLEWEPLGTIVRARLRAVGLSLKDLRRLFAVISPLSYKPLLPQERLMIIAGVADRLAPPKQARLLWDHWDRCPIHWFPGNHVIHFDRGTYLREMGRFLNRIGFVEDSRVSAISAA